MSDDLKLFVEVLYSCPLCGLKDIAVRVPAREEEDVRQWMEATIVHVADDHHFRRPRCRPDSLHDLKIPMIGTDKVGGASRQ